MKRHSTTNNITRLLFTFYNFLTWLLVDSTIIVSSHKYPKGLEFLKAALLWGLYLSNPFFDVFTTSPTFATVAGIAPAQVWGVFLVIFAMTGILGEYTKRYNLKVYGLASVGIYWAIVAGAFVSANALSTSSIVYPWLAYCNLSWAAEIRAAHRIGKGVSNAD